MCGRLSSDAGVHIVCAQMTEDFLAFTRGQDNPLAGLKAGDRWCLCLCLGRWLEAHGAGVAPPVFPESTDIFALQNTDFQRLWALHLSSS